MKVDHHSFAKLPEGYSQQKQESYHWWGYKKGPDLLYLIGWNILALGRGGEREGKGRGEENDDEKRRNENRREENDLGGAPAKFTV